MKTMKLALSVAYDELTATKDPKTKLAKPFNSKLMYIAKVIDRDNEDEVLSFGDLIMTIVKRFLIRFTVFLTV
jgi:large-conductance mechanosensitive channel